MCLFNAVRCSVCCSSRRSCKYQQVGANCTALTSTGGVAGWYLSPSRARHVASSATPLSSTPAHACRSQQYVDRCVQVHSACTHKSLQYPSLSSIQDLSMLVGPCWLWAGPCRLLMYIEPVRTLASKSSITQSVTIRQVMIANFCVTA